MTISTEEFVYSFFAPALPEEQRPLAMQQQIVEEMLTYCAEALPDMPKKDRSSMTFVISHLADLHDFLGAMQASFMEQYKSTPTEV